jgi:hypothetical protein
MVRLLAAKVCAGTPAQVPVHQRDEAIAGGIIATSPGSQQRCHINL